MNTVLRVGILLWALALLAIGAALARAGYLAIEQNAPFWSFVGSVLTAALVFALSAVCFYGGWRLVRAAIGRQKPGPDSRASTSSSPYV